MATSSPASTSTAVIASPNPEFRKQFAGLLSSNRWLAQEAEGGAEALHKLEAAGCEALLLDSWLPDLDVDELLRIVEAQYPTVDVFLLDEQNRQPLNLKRPPQHVRSQQLFWLLKSSVHTSEVLPEAPVAKPAGAKPASSSPETKVTEPKAGAPKSGEPLPGMVGNSARMSEVYHKVRLVAQKNSTVLIGGETGTGKELLARAIHQLSPRSSKPFIVVNCAAIPESLLESELFGYTKGAFTGAVQSRVGLVHAAHGGTLFLDEVGELPLGMQAKLLRFLQEGEVQRLGSQDVFRVDVRVIAATNVDLKLKAAEKTFRPDLFYRLSVFPIHLPALRDRKEDIPSLTEFLVEQYAEKFGTCGKRLSSEVEQALLTYGWPGNVRELQHVTERAMILAGDGDALQMEHFSGCLEEVSEFS